jgi:hypothetical protein
MPARDSASGRGRLIAVLAVAVLIGTACGSTVSQEQFRAAGQNGQAGGTGLSIGSGQTGVGPTGLPTTPTSGAGGPLGGPTGGGIPTGGGSVSRTGQAAFGPGITATTIYFGGYYNKNQGAANAALGVGGADQGDAREPYNAMIEEINNAGGLFGRKVVPVYYGYDATSAQTVDQQDQAACAQWTQDHKVFVINVSNSLLNECARKAGILQFGGSGASNDAVPETYKQYPHRIDIDSMQLVRIGSVTVDGLANHGYFDKRSKIGLVTWDQPNYREALSQGYIATMRSHGQSTGTQPAYIRVPQSPQEIGQTSADLSSAVLRFHSQNIDHVMILDGPAGACAGDCLTIEWIEAAEAQHYRPRYGFNDTNAPQALDDLGILPSDQAKDSISVSWIDLDSSYDVGWHQNAQREKCYAIMRKHGIDMSNVNAQGVANAACGEMWFLQHVMSRIPGTLTVDSFVAAVNGLGYSYASPSSYFNYLSASRHDGNAGARIMHWVDSCNCYKYLTGAYKI